MPVLKSSNPDVLALKGLHLYHAGLSNCSMRVRWLLDEKGLDWTSHPLNLGRQENLADWYFRINPKGLVPSLIDDGVPVTESIDILYYLEDKYPKPSFVPSDAEEAAKVRDWADHATQLHMKAVKTYVYGSMGGATKRRSDMERYAQIEPDSDLVEFHKKSLDGFAPEEVETATGMLRDVFDRMEARLRDHDYLVGDSLTLADIAWAPQYVVLSSIGFDFSAYPRITAWNERLSKRPAYKSAIPDWMPKIPMWMMKPVMKVSQWLRG